MLQDLGPKKSTKFAVLTNFNGYIDSVKFCANSYALPMDPNMMKDCRVDIRGGPNSRIQDKIIRSHDKRAIDFKLTNDPEMRLVPVYKQTDTDLTSFDGVACSDEHKTLKLLNKKSQLSFQTIDLNLEFIKSALTVEFWFKMDLTKRQQGHIFSLYLDN